MIERLKNARHLIEPLLLSRAHGTSPKNTDCFEDCDLKYSSRLAETSVTHGTPRRPAVRGISQPCAPGVASAIAYYRPVRTGVFIGGAQIMLINSDANRRGFEREKPQAQKRHPATCL